MSETKPKSKDWIVLVLNAVITVAHLVIEFLGGM